MKKLVYPALLLASVVVVSCGDSRRTVTYDEVLLELADHLAVDFFHERGDPPLDEEDEYALDKYICRIIPYGTERHAVLSRISEIYRRRSVNYNVRIVEQFRKKPYYTELMFFKFSKRLGVFDQYSIFFVYDDYNKLVRLNSFHSVIEILHGAPVLEYIESCSISGEVSEEGEK